MTGSISRLPRPWGACLDRDAEPVTFTFDGRQITGIKGDTIASAVLCDSNSPGFLARSFKYHRRRSLLLGSGMDANVYVNVDGTPNLPGDKVEIAPGMQVSSQNRIGSLKRDWGQFLGLLSRFLPAGFYYDAFYRPKGIWPYWEKLIRRLAGIGRLDAALESPKAIKRHLFCDIVVVGGGLAGLRAAVSAADRGFDVILIEQDSFLGGSAVSDRLEENEQLVLDQHIEKARAHPKIEVLISTQCTGWFSGNLLTAHGADTYYHICGKKIVLATGVVEQPLVFRNNDLPGVYLASTVQRYLHHYGVRLVDNVVVQTANRFGYELALTLSDLGANVVAIVDMRCGGEEPKLADACTAKNIPVMLGKTVCEAHNGSDSSLRCVSVRDADESAHSSATLNRIDCDSLVTSVGFMPQSQLACHSGGKMVYDETLHTFRITETPQHGFVCGSLNSVFNFNSVLQDADRVAENAINQISGQPSKVAKFPIKAETMTFPVTAFKHSKGREFVDFDEDQTIGDIETAISAGFTHMELVKRYTTVGMGPSQGRTTALNAVRLVAKLTDTSLSSLTVTTQRPPVAPESMANLAAGIETPVRQTVMHSWHLKQGAQMMPAGNWLRPAFYGAPEEEAVCVAREVRAVHEAVGLIDVSTLGGVILRGPDAIELMNRTYIGTFNKMAVGATRYLVMCDAFGAVVDDGVACRTQREEVYLSTASNRSADTFQKMLQIQCEAKLDVSIINVTGSKSVFNLAGPAARATIHSLTTDIDFAADAFPFLGFREGHLNGIPVIIARQGFVGELSYEIHVDSQYGPALWGDLMKAGEAFDIQPFGVLAQRILRLEKAHIIVGQDTDFLTSPDEIGLRRMVRMNSKPFVGRSAIETMREQSATQTLVKIKGTPGLRLVPNEGELIYSGTRSIGRITSSAYSEICGCTIGLALVDAAALPSANSFQTRENDKPAIVLSLSEKPFYDPENNRQSL